MFNALKDFGTDVATGALVIGGDGRYFNPEAIQVSVILLRYTHICMCVCLCVDDATTNHHRPTHAPAPPKKTKTKKKVITKMAVATHQPTN